MARKWTLTPFFDPPFFLTPFLLLVCALILSSCAKDQVGTSSDRIRHFIANEFHRMASQQKYMEFIEREIGAGFTEHDFIHYMEDNGAECDRDAGNGVVYCRYILFGKMVSPRSLWESIDIADFWCFWSIPPAEAPTVRFSKAWFAEGRDFPAQTTKEYARSHRVSSCKDFLFRFNGAEK